MHHFNWKQYIQNYPDLQSAGINNAKMAIRHFNLHGKNEGRTDKIIHNNIFNYNKLLWSKGYGLYLSIESKYVLSSTEEKISIKDLENQRGKNYIWIKMGSTSEIINHNLKLLIDFLDIIEYNVNIITSDGDNSIPDNIDNSIFNELINNKKIIYWYSQNLTNNNIEKLKGIPIGLDLHTNIVNFDILKSFNNIQFKEKIFKIYCDVHLNTYDKFKNQREIINNLKFNTIYYQNKKIDIIDLWKNYSNYVFGVSTHGNGLDCHRTWEMLLLGMIVITKTSPIDHLFKNLPVVIVKDWFELNNEENLIKWYNEYNRFTNSEYIWTKLQMCNYIEYNKITKNKSCIIVGTARNIEMYIQNSIKILTNISYLFNYCPIVIYENDSTDNTISLLNNFEHIKVISEKNIPGNRTTILAYARNKLHDYAFSLNYPFDFYIVCDLDDKITNLTPESILSCFEHQNWSMMGSNQLGNYYDLWALRTKDNWCDHDCWDHKDYCHKNSKPSCISKNIPFNSHPIEVNSCFGGTGIYKFEHTIGCKYKSYKQNFCDERCEHVSFHEDMKKIYNAKLFINPKMINSK
jgi:hypothetical protein